MNEHAKNIWQTWLNGFEVQKLHIRNNFDVEIAEWKNTDPSYCYGDDLPQNSPDLWRITPIVIKKFRLFLSVDNEASVAESRNNENEEEVNAEYENLSCFNRWISDWISCSIATDENE